MTKNLVALEISSSAIKLVVGYELDGDVMVLHAAEKPIPYGAVTGDAVNDFEAVSMAINSLVKDAGNTLGMDIKRVVLGLPPIGFEVFENEHSTNVVSSSGIIAELDVRNVMSLLKRDQYSSDSTVIDIIPLRYNLDKNRTFSNVPIGEISLQLHMEAYIHTLPPRIINDYKKAVIDAGLEIQKLVVVPYGVAQLFTSYNDVPHQYLLIDMGANYTTISTIDRGRPINSTFINNGGHKLTSHIASILGIINKDAEFLKVTYGLDECKFDFQPILVTTKDDDGLEHNYTMKDLKKIIVDYLEVYFGEIKRAVLGLTKEKIKLPLVIVGGASCLNNLMLYSEQQFTQDTVIFPRIKSLGAREQGFLNCLGLIKIGANIVIDDERDISKVTQLTREKTKFPKYSEFEDKL